MPWNLNDNEFRYVLALTAQQRYDYFIKKVVEGGELWSLGTDKGWAVMSDDEGLQHLPVWPHERFAAAAIEGIEFENVPRRIPIKDWMESWLPGMKRDQLQAAVFPTAEGEGIAVQPDQMYFDLKDELTRQEGQSEENHEEQ